MELQNVLKNFGLEEKEAKVYLALLTLREATAAKIAEETNIDRTLMYQLTNKLIGRGLVSYFVKNSVRYFSAAQPETLLKLLQEKEQQLRKALPELKARRKFIRSETKVEIYRGREGVNTILKTIIMDKKQYCISGGAQEACSIFKLENQIFVKRVEKINLSGRILARKKDDFFVGKNEKYRFLSKELISPTTMMLWSNKTAVFVWSEPYYVILIENEEITRGNLATFNYLWAHAERPTKEDIQRRLVKS